MSNAIETKSFQFAVSIVGACRALQSDKKEYALSNQLLRSGTSIGANVAEAQQAQSKADFISKLSTASKEAVETQYWLKLLDATGYITNERFSVLSSDCKEPERILTSIIKTSKTDIP